ncbi:unnamed protein product [Boreogadus saida]
MYFLFHLGSSLSLLLLFPECRDYPARSFLDLRADNAPSVYGRAQLDPAVETPTELLLCPLGAPGRPPLPWIHSLSALTGKRDIPAVGKTAWIP